MVRYKLKGTLDRLWLGLLQVTRYIGGFFLVFMALAVCYDVVMRYFLNAPTLWVVDITGYLLLCIPFLLAAWVLKENGHVEIDVFVGRLNDKTRAMFSISTSLLAAVVCGILVYQTGLETWDSWQRGLYIGSTTLKFPRFGVLLPMPLGSFLLMVQLILQAWQKVQDIKAT